MVWVTRELLPVWNGPGKLYHILCGCKIALAQGCYRWKQDQVLRKLAEATENMTVLANKKPQCYQKQLVLYSLYQQDKQ